jgi:hypothetical protein
MKKKIYTPISTDRIAITSNTSSGFKIDFSICIFTAFVTGISILEKDKYKK